MKTKTKAYTFHALDDDGDRVGVLWDDDLENGLARWRTNTLVTWVDVHGPAGFRRVFVREKPSDLHSDWVAKP